MKDITARIISFVFSPLFWTVFFFAASYRKGLFHTHLQVVIVCMIAIVIPVIVYSILFLTKKISDADITHRQERYFILAVLNICALFVLVFLKLNKLAELFKLGLITYTILTLSSLITLVYKISFHITFAYTFTLLINYLYENKLWYLYGAIPAVFWSRVRLKKHTVLQVLLALCIDSIIIYGLL